MIKIPVDDAYAFDYLSILKLKSEQRPSEQNTKNFKECEEYLSQQLGQKFNEVTDSEEYLELLYSNIRVFKAVEEARKGIMLAKDLDAVNTERFLCKKALQKKFFDEEIKEFKT